MILLRPELFEALAEDGKPPVLCALQQAIELEHATIPLYLYALYSLDATKNTTVAQIIQSVVMEEMLHMTLACNILNALGGDTAIDNPSFVPSYPGHLPGGVESDLKVHLAPFSRVQLATFLKIEEPENPLKFPDAMSLMLSQTPRTIGQFYALIRMKIVALGDGAFPPAMTSRQVGPDLMDGSIIVTDVKTAAAAIDMIVEQGEGNAESPLEAATGDVVAHYYRFAEILHGKKLIKNPAASPTSPPDEQYIYGGDPVPFDESGVYAAPVDPTGSLYPAGSPARQAFDTFNLSYTSLLKSLQVVFSGSPNNLDAATSLMISLKKQARNMMSGKNPPGINVGPSFEYQAVQPG